MKKAEKKDPNEMIEMVVAEGSVKVGKDEYVHRGESGQFPRQDVERKPGKFVSQKEWDAMAAKEEADAKLAAVRDEAAGADEEEEVEEVDESGNIRKSRRKKHR